LRASLGLSGGEFEKYARTVLHYRDKFVAHLDEELKKGCARTSSIHPL
jgi:hypothetical protein